jgi:hypothetical protein
MLDAGRPSSANLPWLYDKVGARCSRGQTRNCADNMGGSSGHRCDVCSMAVRIGCASDVYTHCERGNIQCQARSHG